MYFKSGWNGWEILTENALRESVEWVGRLRTDWLLDNRPGSWPLLLPGDSPPDLFALSKFFTFTFLHFPAVNKEMINKYTRIHHTFTFMVSYFDFQSFSLFFSSEHNMIIKMATSSSSPRWLCWSERRRVRHTNWFWGIFLLSVKDRYILPVFLSSHDDDDDDDDESECVRMCGGLAERSRIPGTLLIPHNYTFQDHYVSDIGHSIQKKILI